MDNYSSFAFFNRGGAFSSITRNTLGDIGKDDNPYLLDSAGCPITHHGTPIRKNDHIMIETDHGIMIRSEGETIHLEKVAKDEWPVLDELIKNDMTWWEKFKRKFK